MPAHPSEQKRYIAKVARICACDDETALKFLRLAKWDMQRAVDEYFNSGRDTRSSDAIKAIFQSYRQEDDEDNQVGLDGAIRFLNDINVPLEEVVCLGILELCKAPTMGEFTEEGFIDGWRSVSCTTIDQMKSHAKNLRSSINNNPDLARRIYKYTFLLSRMAGQRNVGFDIAVDQWRLFFGDDGVLPGNSDTTPWLDWWREFLEGRGKKPVSKDLWEQLALFLAKANEDESMSWWNEDGAWPGAIDEFVEWVQEKRNSEMEVE